MVSVYGGQMKEVDVINETIDGWMRRYLGGESLRDIGKKDDVNYETVRKFLKMSGVRMRGLSESISLAWRKRAPKTSFNESDEGKAYLTMFVVGDCSTWRFPYLIRVSTSTTHYAQIDLFHDLFSKYGKVNMGPKFDCGRGVYEYYLSCSLDLSFNFLHPKPTTIPQEILENEALLLRSLEGYADAEGSIFPYCSRGHTYAAFVLHSKDYTILTTFYMVLRRMGYNPYLNIYQHRIYGNYLRLGFSGEGAITMLKKLEFRHREKTEAKRLVLKLHGEKWSQAKTEYKAFKNRVKEEVQRCCENARNEYILRHGQLHPKDIDQTIPPIISESASQHPTKVQGV